MANNPSNLTESSSVEIAALASNSRTVAAWTLLSRITGFGRVMSIAAVLGPTYFGNLFQTLNALPNLAHDLLAGSLITAMLVPPLAHRFEQLDLHGARQLAAGFLGVVLLVCVAIVSLSLVTAPLILTLVTGAVRDPAVREWQFRLGLPLLWMLMPQLFFYGVISVASAVQNAQHRFALAAAAPALENIGTVAVMIASALIFGVAPDVSAMTSTHLLFLGLGSTSAVGIHAAVQWWGAYRVGVPLLPSWGWRNLEIRSVIGVAMPSSIYAALGSVSYLGLLVVAGSIPGGTVAFQIGLNFFHLPIALCARPVAAAQLPLLARNFDQGHLAAFSEIYRAGLAFTAFIALPASLLFCGIAETLARAISFGGMAGPSGIALVAAAVGSLSLGIIGDALFIVATSASYARRDAATPLQAMVVRAALIFAGIAVALWAMPMQGTLVLWALGMSASAANLVSAAYLHGKLKRVLSTQPRSWIRRLLGNFAAASGAAISGIVVADWLANTTQTSYERVGVAVAAVLASSTCYLTVQRLRNSEELRQLCAGALPGRSPELVLGLHRQSDVGAKPSATDGPP